jgi:uncharacterized membrane protein
LKQLELCAGIVNFTANSRGEMRMTMLLAAALVFLAMHLLVAGTRLRDTITTTIGEGAYLGLFSLASVAAIAWLAISYRTALASPDNVALFAPGEAVRNLAIPLTLIAFLIAVPGLLMANPTAVGQSGAAARENSVRGILRVTRHPFLWGVALWSLFHLSATGDLASLILFGSLFILSVLGTLSIDAKRRRKLAEGWNGFASRTSNFPFAAIVSGRNVFNAREYFDWRFFAALAIYVLALFAHARVIGVSPFPGGWIPF